MGTCKDCIFWNQIGDSYQGDCEQIVEQQSREEVRQDAIIFGVGGHYDSVSTGKFFGCIHFKDKTISLLEKRVIEIESRLMDHVNSDYNNAHTD